MAVLSRRCDMIVLVLLIGFLPTASGNACASWINDVITVCTQNSLIGNNLYLDFSAAKDNIPCSCRATFTGNDTISVIPYVLPAAGCGTEIIVQYSGHGDSTHIRCPGSIGSGYTISGGYLSIVINLQTGHNTPMDTTYCLNIQSGNRRSFNLSCESDNTPESTSISSSPVRSSTAIVDTTKPSTWSTTTARDIETTIPGASSQTVTTVVAVVGSLVVLAIICIIFIILCYRRRNLKTPQAETSVRRDKYSYDHDISTKDLTSGTSQSCDKHYEDITGVEAAQTHQKTESPQNDAYQLHLQSSQTKQDGGNMNSSDFQNPVQKANEDDTSTVIYAKPDKHVVTKSEDTKRNKQFPVYALPDKKKKGDVNDEVAQTVNRKNPTNSLVNNDGLQYADLCLENDTAYNPKRDLNLHKKGDVEYADLQL